VSKIVHPESFIRHKADAMNMFRAAMWQMHPENRTKEVLQVVDGQLQVNGISYDISERPVWVIGAGKAAHTMAAAVEGVLGDHIDDGLIITTPDASFTSRRILALPGSHPLPSDASLAASIELDRLVRRIPNDALVIALVSGGTSSLVTLPPNGIHIDDVSQTVDILLRCGAGISDINTVRRHLCQLKGGNLAKKLRSTHLLTLVYSDVPGDRLHDIGSGMTVPDPTSFADALNVIDQFGLAAMIPVPLLRYLQEGADSKHPENPKSQAEFETHHHIVMLGSSDILAKHVASQAEAHGYKATVFNPAYNTTARIQSREIASRVKETALTFVGKQVLIFHGESNVHVTGQGKGGRNQELALLVLLALEENSVPWTLMSIGTDGIDGNTDAAGAFVYNGLLSLARHHGYSPEGFLLDNDAYHFFLGTDTLIRTGPTGNNMTDLQILILDP
jgi:glycerate 2-kinase